MIIGLAHSMNNETKPVIPIEEVILRNWVACAAANIITLKEAMSYLDNGYMTKVQLYKMFPKLIND
jgi:hypothetical protein